MTVLSHRWRGVMWLSLAVAICIAARLFPSPLGLTLAGQSVLGVVAAGVVLWVSEAVPLGLTALFVLAALGTVPYDRAATFAGFASPVVFFLIGAVAIATAVESTGLARRIASLLIRRARGSPRRLYVEMLVMLPGLAFVLPSAITRNAVLIPAYRDALNAMGMAGSQRTGRAIMLALGVLNPLASSALLTGGIVSMTAAALIGDVSWLRWFCLMAVPYYVLLILGGITLRLMVGRFEESRAEVDDTPQGAPFSATEWRTVAILLFTSAFWLADFIHGLPPAIPALIAAVLLVCPRIGVIGWKDFETRLSWGLVLTVGASLSLAQALIHTGAADWLGQEFLLISTSLTQNPLLLVGVILVTVSMVHLAITNLAACIALLIPVTMTVAKAAGLNPIVCGLIVTIVIDSVILYPVQTATNLLAYESGYYGTRDVGRFGLMMLGLTMLVGLGVALPYWSALGLPLVLR